MRVLVEPLFNAIASESIRKPHLAELHHCAKLVWSYSFLTSPFDVSRFISMLLPVILRNLDQMNSPGAHSVLWGVWQSSRHETIHELFELWRDADVDPDDLAGSADILLTDAEWQRGSWEASLLEMSEGSISDPFIQGVVSKAIRGYVMAETVAAHVWDQEKVERNKPELAKYLMHFPAMDRWAQPGAGNHWRKLGLLVEHMDALTDLATSPGMPASMLHLIERFAEGARQWLKVAGGAKAAVLEHAMRQRKWRPWEVLLECGAFIGYTAIRLAMLLRELGGGRAVTVEVDPIQACIARHFIDLAGVSNTVEVWIGQFRDILARPVEEFGARSMGFVFLDYKGTIFHIDLAAIEHFNLLAPGGHAVADNVALPGAPLYLWEVTHHPAWETCAWALQEFLEPNVEDWMCCSIYVAPVFPDIPPPPEGWQKLSWHTDHMRRRAQGMRPGESGMAEIDRIQYSQYIRDHFVAAGIEAMPWTTTVPQRARFEVENGSELGRSAWPRWGGNLPGSTFQEASS